MGSLHIAGDWDAGNAKSIRDTDGGMLWPVFWGELWVPTINLTDGTTTLRILTSRVYEGAPANGIIGTWFAPAG